MKNKNNIYAVILAAGRGTRLRPWTNDIPKTLLPLANKKSILDFQIEKITQFIPLNNIIISIGYKKSLIIKKYPNLHYVFNQNYQNNNTGKSLLLALKKIENKDVLWLNGDVCFDEKIIQKILHLNHSCVVVDTASCKEEEVKYTLNQDGFINQISKDVKNGQGEALGINFIKAHDLEIFKKALERTSNKAYFEKAMEVVSINNDIKFLPLQINHLFCHEIDFLEDLRFVRHYLKK